MSSDEYRFLTHWRIHGPREIVYKILSEGKNYPNWWRPAYLACEEVGANRIKATVRARLPYTLTFTTQLIRENPPKEFLIRSTGELDGTGHWRLSQNDGLTDVEFQWNVKARKPFVQYFSFLLKPLFVWNHNWVMKTGEAALQAEVDRRQGNSPTTSGQWRTIR